MKLQTIGWGTGLGLIGCLELGAVGFRLPNQDPEGIARGNAFVATADNPSAIYHNPAGITQLEGHQLSVGTYVISTGIDFTSVDGRKARADSSAQVVPQIHYVFSPGKSRWSYGLGIYAPYGLGIDWGSNTPFSTKIEEAVLVYGTFNPVAAYQVTDWLSIAAGVTVNYSEVEFQQALVPGGGGQFRYEGDDVAVGFNFGVLFQPNEKWSFGLNYRSATQMKYKGESRAGFPTPGDYQSTTVAVDFPDNIDLGVSYRPNKDWNIEFNVDWTDWDKVNVSTFEGTPFGNVDLPFNYRSSFMYELGVTRQLGRGYWISAGYIYAENSVPDATLNPSNPDADLHLGSIGFGRRGENWGWAVGYHFGYNGGREVRGNAVSAGGESADGKFETFNHAVNVAIHYKF